MLAMGTAQGARHWLGNAKAPCGCNAPTSGSAAQAAEAQSCTQGAGCAGKGKMPAAATSNMAAATCALMLLAQAHAMPGMPGAMTDARL